MELDRDPGAWCAEFLRVWNEHDVEAALETFTPDGAWEFTAGSEPWGEAHVGHPAIRTLLAEILDAVPDVHYELVRHHAGPGHLTMEVRVTGTTEAGERLDYHACDIVTLAGTKVATKRSYRKLVSPR